MRKICSILILAAAAALLLGCGGGSDAETAELPPERFRRAVVTLDGDFNAENLGLLMAWERGYFDDYNLGVELRNPVLPERPVQYVSERAVDLAVSHQPQVVLAKEKGLPIVAVASLVSQPTAAMIWLKKSRIGGVADLKGKTIAIYGLRSEKELLRSVLARAGLSLDDVKVKSVNYETVPVLVRGGADAIFGASGNVEGASLRARGLQPVITRVQDLGVPAYDELVVIAHSDRLAEDPRLIPDLMAAVSRGTAAAIEDPEAAVEAIVDQGDAIVHEGDEPSRGAIRASVEATLPLLSRTGRMDPEQASGLVAWMREEEMIQRTPAVPEWLTNDYLSQP